MIANHFLEHCENPIKAFLNMLRVLRPGGILFLAVPDKRHTFDRDRPVTPLAHLVRDYEEGPGWSRKGHFEEWVRLVHKVDSALKSKDKWRSLFKRTTASIIMCGTTPRSFNSSTHCELISVPGSRKNWSRTIITKSSWY